MTFFRLIAGRPFLRLEIQMLFVVNWNYVYDEISCLEKEKAQWNCLDNESLCTTVRFISAPVDGETPLTDLR